MPAKLQTTRNPYQSPSTGVSSCVSEEPKKRSGLSWLLVGIAISVVCLLISGYFALCEIPCVLDTLEQRNAKLPLDLWVVSRCVPFVINYWLVFVLPILAMLLATEWQFTGDTKEMVRRWTGFGIGLTSVIFTSWLAWATLSQADWKLLYLL